MFMSGTAWPRLCRARRRPCRHGVITCRKQVLLIPVKSVLEGEKEKLRKVPSAFVWSDWNERKRERNRVRERATEWEREKGGEREPNRHESSPWFTQQTCKTRLKHRKRSFGAGVHLNVFVWAVTPGDTLHCQQVCVCVCVKLTTCTVVTKQRWFLINQRQPRPHDWKSFKFFYPFISFPCLHFYRSLTLSRLSLVRSHRDFPLLAIIKDGISLAPFAGAQAGCHLSLSTFCAAQVRWGN